MRPPASPPHALLEDLRLDPTAFVAPGATVVGRVTLGARASVWFSAVIRGDMDTVTLGEESNLQDGAVVHVDEGHPTRIGRRVTIGHRAIVHAATIENGCLIGMASIVLTGAHVGAGSLVAAGALVREGQVIPPGSLALGFPAKVLGPVSEAHREAIRRGTEHYVELSRGYMARGFARPHPRIDSVTGISARAPGPLGFLEWEQLLSTLVESPAWVERRLERAPGPRWSEPPAPGRSSAVEVLCHLRDVDLEMYLPRVRLVLGGAVELPDVKLGARDLALDREQDPAIVLAGWRAARATLLDLLRPLGPRDWARFAIHPRRGPYPLGEMVRALVEHDLSQRRLIAEALGEFGS